MAREIQMRDECAFIVPILRRQHLPQRCSLVALVCLHLLACGSAALPTSFSCAAWACHSIDQPRAAMDWLESLLGRIYSSCVDSFAMKEVSGFLGRLTSCRMRNPTWIRTARGEVKYCSKKSGCGWVYSLLFSSLQERLYLIKSREGRIVYCQSIDLQLLR